MDREEGSSEEDLQNMLVGSFPRKPKKMEEINTVYSDGLPYNLIQSILFQCYYYYSVLLILCQYSQYYAIKVNIMPIKSALCQKNQFYAIKVNIIPLQLCSDVQLL